ncbi:MAG: sugar isomerase [Planctomycetes bacterium]|nr:sugar isomerase [Planctomycetota bacterium]
MNTKDAKYTQFALCREMMDVVGVAKTFDPARTAKVARALARTRRLMLTGEGSSRIFPAKNARRKALAWGLDLQVVTDGSRQAATYDLSKFATFLASNSGRTQEVVVLAKALQAAGRKHVYGLTANAGTILEASTTSTFVLTCGWEQAVAATKSVAEQAMIYQSIISHIAGRDMAADMKGLDRKLAKALAVEIPGAIVRKAAAAGTIYFAGYNDGVAEELTLKTNEITRKRSDFLEGTYAVHGIEEIMDRRDIVFVVDPIREEVGKFVDVLAKGVGLTVVAIANRPVKGLETIVVPNAGEMNPYVFLAAGWNLLVEIGLALGINLDKAERARKVGNEFTGKTAK